MLLKFSRVSISSPHCLTEFNEAAPETINFPILTQGTAHFTLIGMFFNLDFSLA